MPYSNWTQVVLGLALIFYVAAARHAGPCFCVMRGAMVMRTPNGQPPFRDQWLFWFGGGVD
jgi:hypothetical protein